jgi:ribosomal protein S18 acetylase RimI-like enzyme
VIKSDSSNSMTIFYDLVQSNELVDALHIETKGFPPEEAASLLSFQYRQSHAPHLFLGVFEPKGSDRRLLGYVCSTQALADTLEHHSMSTHVEQGSSVCIHSVCIHPEHKRQGLGMHLLNEYVRRLESAQVYERILLICHDELINFYEKCGFTLVGESKVQHGGGRWYEMKRILDGSGRGGVQQDNSQSRSQEMPAGLWEALQASSARERPTPLSSHQSPEVVSVTGSDGVIKNKYDLLCPRSGCSSIILKKGVAKLVERSSVQVSQSSTRFGV